MKTVPTDRDGSSGTGTWRSPPPDTHTSGSLETLVRRNVAGPAHHACRRPASGTSRNDRAPVGAARLVRLGAVDTRRRQSPRRQAAQASYPTAQRCGINRLPNSLEFSIAEISIATAAARSRICAAPASRLMSTASERSPHGVPRNDRCYRGSFIASSPRFGYQLAPYDLRFGAAAAVCCAPHPVAVRATR